MLALAAGHRRVKADPLCGCHNCIAKNVNHEALVMVLDAAKGIEEQTRKLFEVCRLATWR